MKKFDLEATFFDEHNDKIKALDELFEKSKRYQNSKEFLDLLKFINRFPKLSPFNAFLIHMQNSGVNIVMNAGSWKRKFKRTIKPYARPMVILVPFGPVDFVYDIADTEGSEIPEHLLRPFYTSGNFDDTIFYQTIDHLRREAIIYNEEVLKNAVAGYARKEEEQFSITLNKTYGVREMYTTFVHEIAHIFCGHLGRFEYNWWPPRKECSNSVKETEAESIAFLVCNRFGLNSNSESYLSDYVKENETMPLISFDTILTVSGYIEQMAKSNFRSKNK